MKIKDKCLPCLVNQVIKVSDITNAENREELYKKVFAYLSNMDYNKTNPEVTGETFSILKSHIGNNDPYYNIRRYYNELLLSMTEKFEEIIENSNDTFLESMKYAVLGNIIDFNPIHNSSMEDIMKFFKKSNELKFSINHMEHLISDLHNSKSLLYLGDNCGEICLDKIFIKKIKEKYPNLNIYFGVRGEPVVNDSIEEDAYFVKIDKYAKVISNGDNSLGTVIERTSDEFKKVYNNADVIIAKGQANYECLSEHNEKNIYFMLMTKCEVIADDIGVPVKSLICMSNLYR